MTLSLLRFITAGSVDDGKSTLIGRLLFDSKSIFDDQLQAIQNSKFRRTSHDIPDLSLLTDGLEAEREQGITIDVAYRYFATINRKFIIADSPGHEQYTRNMVTAASTADAVIVLIDAAKIKGRSPDDLLLPQSKRHTLIAHLMGVKHVIVAVNKMDLFDFDETLFNQIKKNYQSFAASLGFSQIFYVPISALKGDNVVFLSTETPWYRAQANAQSILQILDSLDIDKSMEKHDSHSVTAPLRFPVQWVARHNGSATQDFRAYAGTVCSGALEAGMTIKVLSSVAAEQTATIVDIGIWGRNTGQGASGVDAYLPQNKVPREHAAMIRLDKQLDISRGAMIVRHDDTSIINTNSFCAHLCWLSETPFNPATKYWLKHTTRQVITKISQIQHHINIHDLSPRQSAELQLNDIAKVELKTQEPIFFDRYADCRRTGSFILIDPIHHGTVAAGMILTP